MKTVLNILWLVFSGLWMAIAYVLFGILACVLIVTIPFGIASFRIARYALWPFGRTIVRRNDAGFASALGNLVWLIFCGIWLALGHVISGILLCITIIGIPLGVANFKMVPISLTPLGRQIVRIGGPYGAPSQSRTPERFL
jgi:uncharacterized membrane protein YccF (DUF307 family)